MLISKFAYFINKDQLKHYDISSIFMVHIIDWHVFYWLDTFNDTNCWGLYRDDVVGDSQYGTFLYKCILTEIFKTSNRSFYDFS